MSESGDRILHILLEEAVTGPVKTTTVISCHYHRILERKAPMKKQNRLLVILIVVLVIVFPLSTMGRPARAESLKAPKTKTPTPSPTPTPGATTIGNIIPMP